MEKDWVEQLQELANHLAWLKPGPNSEVWLLNAMAALCAKAKIHSSGDFNRFMGAKLSGDVVLPQRGCGA